MKTLDEVIKAVEVCSHGKGCEHCCYRVVDEDGFEMYLDCPKKDEDVLQWLKGYKDHIELDKLRDKYGVTSQKLRNTSQITCPKCHSEFVILPEANNPLTWDELKSMEGKLVWIEDTYCKFYGWEIVERLGTNKWMTGEFLETNGGLYRKEDQGESWQAYRKERL